MDEPKALAEPPAEPESSFIKRIFDAMPGAVGYWDTDLIARFANQAFFDWFGKAPEAVLGTHYRELVNEQFYRANEPYVLAALAGSKQCYERTVPKADGVRHLLVNYIPDYNDAGAVAGFFVFVNDVTHIKSVEAQLEIGAAVFEAAADGIMVTDAAGTVLSVNPAFTEITGFTADEAVGQNPRIMKSDRHGPEFYAELWAELMRTGSWQGEVWNRRKTGEIFIEWQTIRRIRSGDDQTVRYVSVFSDITETWRNDERIRHLAYHDELTGLPNRSVLTGRLSDMIAVAELEAHRLAVMFIDLDGFKAVNDRLGHAAGDSILKTVAQRLQGLVRSTDLVARVGGDEFVALLRNIRGEEPVARIACSMIAAINEPLDLQGETAHVGVSIGIAMYPSGGGNAADLVREADEAMYVAKASGKNTYCFARSALTAGQSPLESPAT
jgi:diguanylate cyclase (GGDEF)-like protein/PAS domain S-box-containing protein